MNAQIAAVVVTAAVSIATTLVAVFYGPSWKDRIEARRASRQRSENCWHATPSPWPGPPSSYRAGSTISAVRGCSQTPAPLWSIAG